MKKRLFVILLMTFFLTGCENNSAGIESTEALQTAPVESEAATAEPVATEPTATETEAINYLSMDRPMNLVEGMDPLYKDFLTGEITSVYTYEYDGKQIAYEVTNAIPEEWGLPELDEYPNYRYCILDVNGDGEDELIYDISIWSSEELYVLKNVDGKLITTTCEETHTTRMGFYIYANGVMTESGSWGGPEDYCTFYEFDKQGYPVETMHFCVSENYDYDGDVNACYYNGDVSTIKKATYEDCIAILDELYDKHMMEWISLF